MKIYVNGCEFTSGDGLVAWPTLLGEKISAEVVNDARPGISNYDIVYNTIKNSKQDYDLFIISWSEYSRFTFYPSKKLSRLDLSTHSLPIITKKAEREWAERLYTDYYNELYSFKFWLQQIIQLQSVLDNRNYCMIRGADNSLSYWQNDFYNQLKKFIKIDQVNDKQIEEEKEEINYYIKLIDKNKFYQWDQFSFDTMDYSKKSQEAHEFVSDLIIDHLNLKDPV